MKPGTPLGPYEVLAPLGAGGMGEVWRAHDARLGRDVAVKILPAEVAHDPERRARFEREGRAVAALSHPNILTVYDVGVHEAAAYVVTELLEGETLRQRLADGALPPRKAVEIAAQIANGLAAAHDKGIVHRDLKPENVFVTRDGRVKILDFGLAAQLPAKAGDTGDSPTVAGLTNAGVVLGTAGYMSPEQVRGARVDHRTDIFALGAVFYELLAGRRAFQRDTAAETMTAILREEAPDLSVSGRQVPQPLDRIVRRCLEKNPDERLQAARDVAIALEAVWGSDVSSSAAMPAVAARPRWLRIALGAGCLLLAVAAGVVFARFTAAPAPLVQEPPRFTQLTFRRGYSSEARFAPDGQSVVYSAIWDSEPMRVYPVRIDAPRGDAAALAEGALKAVSAAGNIALASQPQLMDLFTLRGTLAQVPLSGGAPRELLERVDAADYAPDGRLAVVRASGGRTRLEYPAGTVVYETTGWLSAPRFSPSGDRIAFLEHPLFDDDRGWPAVVDIRTRDKRNLTPEQGTLSGLAWAPGGGDVCFASEATIRCVSSTAPSRPRLVLRSGPRMILHDVAPDGRMLVSAYMVRGRTQVAGASGRETDLSYQDVSFPVGVTADGQRLLFGSINYGVYVRGTDGKPAVRLADGIPMGFSPDGKFVLTMIPEKPTSVAIVPTGAGEMEKLPRGPLESHTAASWMPDGRRIVLSGSEPGHGSRLYLQERSGGDPRPISAEGVRLKLYQPDVVSSDGRFVIAIGPSEQPALYPTAGGDPVPVPGLGEDLVPIGWTDSPTVIFARQRALGRLSSVYKVDVRTGRRELWKALGPDDPTGAPVVTAVQVSAGGRYYAYLQSQFASDLFLVRGALDVPGREVAR